MRPNLRLASLLFIVACTTSLPVSPTQVVGAWGGQDIQVRDSTALHGVLVEMTCNLLMFPAPLTVDSLGRFSAIGSVIATTENGPKGERFTIDGTLEGNVMHLALAELDPLPSGEHATVYTLVKGHPAVRGPHDCAG